MHNITLTNLYDNSCAKKEDVDLVVSIIENFLNEICNEETINSGNLDIHGCSSILLLLTELNDCFGNKTYYEEFMHKYLIKLKDMIEQTENVISTGIFGGLSDVGFTVYHMNEIGFRYNKLQTSINNFIAKYVYDTINYINENQGKLHPVSYDAISGLSGIVSYLLFFKDDEHYSKIIQDIATTLISITEFVQFDGELFPGWHVATENMYLDSEKEYYTEGLFNYGLSHGVSGVLAALSLVLINKIEVEGQKEAIARLINEYKKVQFKNESAHIYWPERVRKQDYKGKSYPQTSTRASWCYGTPGIARSIYLAGKALNDQETISIAIKAFKDLCSMQDEDYMLISPIICHGYAGILASLDAMYVDTKDPVLNIGRKKIFDKILMFYNKDNKYGFTHVERNKFQSDKSNSIIEIDDLSLLEGSSGIIMALLLVLRPSSINWQRHILIN